MVVAESECEGAAPALEYVEHVAESRTFSGSSSLPRLLLYLAERAQAEPGQPIKEFRVATEALGRGKGFDSRTDSVVRVTTARLRNKLAEYYASEGADDPIRLEVPKGSYQLLAVPAQHHSAPAAEPKPAAARARWLVVAAIAVLSSFGAGYFFGYESGPLRRTAADPELSRFWQAFADSPGGVRVVYSNVAHGVTSYGRVLTKPPSVLAPEPDDWHTGVGEVQAILRLARVANRLDIDLDLKRALLVNWDEVVDVHVVYLGGPAANPQVADLGAHANFVFEGEAVEQGEQYRIRNRAPIAGEPAVYESSLPLTGDYGIVRLARGFRSDRWTLLLAGITTFGTAAAAEIVSDPVSLRQIRTELDQQLDDPLEPFECVVGVGVKNSVPFQPRLKACRTLETQQASFP